MSNTLKIYMLAIISFLVGTSQFVILSMFRFLQRGSLLPLLLSEMRLALPLSQLRWRGWISESNS